MDTAEDHFIEKLISLLDTININNIYDFDNNVNKMTDEEINRFPIAVRKLRDNNLSTCQRQSNHIIQYKICINYVIN